eukprot:scaffold783_cov197-Alexandrium_tamarense.AAC.13
MSTEATEDETKITTIVNLRATATSRKSQQSMNSIMNKFDFKYQLFVADGWWTNMKPQTASSTNR